MTDFHKKLQKSVPLFHKHKNMQYSTHPKAITAVPQEDAQKCLLDYIYILILYLILWYGHLMYGMIPSIWTSIWTKIVRNQLQETLYLRHLSAFSCSNQMAKSADFPTFSTKKGQKARPLKPPI